MKSEKFDVVKCIAYGTFSIVYEISYPESDSKMSTTKWALKRFYLQNTLAVWRALRERNVLVRLALSSKAFECVVVQPLCCAKEVVSL